MSDVSFFGLFFDATHSLANQLPKAFIDHEHRKDWICSLNKVDREAKVKDFVHYNQELRYVFKKGDRNSGLES